MRRNDFDKMLQDICDKIEKIEFTGVGEEGIVSYDEFVKSILREYSVVASKEKWKEIKKYIKKLPK